MQIDSVRPQKNNLSFQRIWKTNSDKGLEYFRRVLIDPEISGIFKTSKDEHLFVYDSLPIPDSIKHSLTKAKLMRNLSEEQQKAVQKSYERIDSNQKNDFSILKSILDAIDKTSLTPIEKEAAKQAQIDKLSADALNIPDIKSWRNN